MVKYVHLHWWLLGLPVKFRFPLSLSRWGRPHLQQLPLGVQQCIYGTDTVEAHTHTHTHVTMHEVNETDLSDTDKSLNTVEHTCITYRYNKLACTQIMSRRGAMVVNRRGRKVGGKCIQGREREGEEEDGQGAVRVGGGRDRRPTF